MAHDNRPIGIFDSGLGGLTVAAALRRQLPEQDLIYLGDTARVPYGSKSRDTVIRFALEDAAFLVAREVKAVVVACNTVSSVAMPALSEAFPETPVLGVVDAGARQALTVPDLARLAVIGTAATIDSDSYRMLVHRQAPEVAVRSIACPLFVPLVEAGWTDDDIARQIAARYLADVIREPPDALILGCTHYPLLEPLIRDLLPPSVCLVDSAEACAAAVGDFLSARGMTPVNGRPGREQYFVTDMPASFFHLAARFLGRQPTHVDKVTL